MHWKRLVSAAVVGVTLLATAGSALALTEDEMVAMLVRIDERQHAAGDFKAHAFIQQKQKGKEDVAFESVFYRRGADDKFMILVLAPKTEAGQGYLRIDDNLWLYSPKTGKWERVTERDRILGTDGRRQDFDESRLAVLYTPEFLGEGKLGKFETWKIKLKAKPGKDVAWPLVVIEIDKGSGNILKQQDFALSEKLMRTSLYPRWSRITDAEGKEVWYPAQMYLYDEVEKGNQSIVKVDKVDLTTLPKNMFTKAWLESKSR
ncbi:MAG: outer membrane lipoprotein-sorting protein [Deltaproteobacteria bacterium]|nr:MAG: outer membrane lipoprotein-sorting protein [Deltaproteobacteria bacterium]